MHDIHKYTHLLTRTHTRTHTHTRVRLFEVLDVWGWIFLLLEPVISTTKLKRGIWCDLSLYRYTVYNFLPDAALKRLRRHFFFFLPLLTTFFPANFFFPLQFIAYSFINNLVYFLVLIQPPSSFTSFSSLVTFCLSSPESAFLFLCYFFLFFFKLPFSM